VKPEPYRRRSLVPGIAISLSLHAGLLAWAVHQRAPLPAAAAPSRWLTVSLLPAPRVRQPDPPPLPQPARERPPRPLAHTPPAPVTTAPPRRETAPQQLPAATAELQSAPPARSNDAPDPFAAPPARQPGTFDTNAALASARRLAIAKAGKDDPAVAQLQDKPVNGLASESALGKDIKGGARPDCLTAGAGAGLLAPLVVAAMVLTDKKDSGCKW
jgi:hypothetical protein